MISSNISCLFSVIQPYVIFACDSDSFPKYHALWCFHASSLSNWWMTTYLHSIKPHDISSIKLVPSCPLSQAVIWCYFPIDTTNSTCQCINTVEEKCHRKEIWVSNCKSIKHKKRCPVSLLFNVGLLFLFLMSVPCLFLFRHLLAASKL